MKWKFWELHHKKEDLYLEKIKDLEEQITNLHNIVVELGTSNKQMNRLQYKHNQEIKKTLADIGYKIEKNQLNDEKFKELERSLKNYQSILFKNVDFLISFIDEIDLISQKLSANEEKWHGLLTKWREELLKKLEEQGVYEIDIINTKFNPHLAEAINTISRQDIEKSKENTEYNNYDIVEVLKRAYKDNTGAIIRKATVTIFKEEEN